MRAKGWYHPSVCNPPHKVTHPFYMRWLARQFEKSGWDTSCPALVGYDHDGKIQLLSGSHRWAAAAMTNTLLPVVVYDYQTVRNAWGDTDKWKAIMEGHDFEHKLPGRS